MNKQTSYLLTWLGRRLFRNMWEYCSYYHCWPRSKGRLNMCLTEAPSPTSWTFYATRRSWARTTLSSSWLLRGGDSRWDWVVLPMPDFKQTLGPYLLCVSSIADTAVSSCLSGTVYLARVFAHHPTQSPEFPVEQTFKLLGTFLSRELVLRSLPGTGMQLFRLVVLLPRKKGMQTTGPAKDQDDQ